MTPDASSLGCPRRGAPWSRALARRILALAGWRVVGSLPDAPRFVMIAAPHTSNWDFPIGMMAMLSVGLQVTWLGKHTLFRFPVRGLLRWLGGEPVDRSAAQEAVPTAIRLFETRPQWVFGVSPEGTRKRVEQWKTGFHRVAVGAGVPILPVVLDHRSRTLSLGTLYVPTADLTADLAVLQRLYEPEMARFPEQYASAHSGIESAAS